MTATSNTSGMNAEPNRLAQTRSPYLRQHADNPVDWFPWGEAAFKKAVEENKPVFLSIGYSACHWCHVMAHESFEDQQTADLMNRHFIAVKVDREERPDVDEVYMEAVQAMTGQGGWPLSVFLTPDGEPFYGGTYYPPEPRHGMPSFRQVLQRVADVWQEDHEALLLDAGRISDWLGSRAGKRSLKPMEDGRGVIGQAVSQLKQRLDLRHGGLGGAPKFPQVPALMLLLRHGEAADLKPTLRAMAHGGIYDHVGGGFHRYAVDAEWRIPHFEKMLYDQALLADFYLQAWRVDGDPLYRQVVEETLQFVLRDMTAPEGGFYAALDADSSGREGLYYLWTVGELRDALGDDADPFIAAFGVRDPGWFEHKNILYLADPGKTRSAARNPGQKQMLERLRAVRESRVPPAMDTKILAMWNGLMIAALARAGVAFEEPEFTSAAVRAADFMMQRMRDDQGLYRSYAAGQAYIPAYLDDYAAMVTALLDLYQATWDPAYVEQAVALAEEMATEFSVDGRNLLRRTSNRHDALMVERYPLTDSVVPSGNALAAQALLRVSAITLREDLRERAEQILTAGLADASRSPAGYPALLAVLAEALEAPMQIALLGDPGEQTVHEWGQTVRRLRPHAAMALLQPGQPVPVAIPWLEGKQAHGNRVTAVVCLDHVCLPPVSTKSELIEQLNMDTRRLDR